MRGVSEMVRRMVERAHLTTMVGAHTPSYQPRGWKELRLHAKYRSVCFGTLGLFRCLQFSWDGGRTLLLWHELVRLEVANEKPEDRWASG